MSYALVMQALYFSQFFTRFFGDFTEFVLVQMYVCSLLVSCVADNQNLNESCIFLNEKHTLLYSIESPERREIAFEDFGISREHAPSRGAGLTPLVDTVGYSIQTCWLLLYLLKPLVPCSYSVACLNNRA